VAPLLELGAGFDHELTGRENIFLNGAILGRRLEEMASRFDPIVEFAGLREFIDVPIRRYSSGMVARLGFAIATDAEREVLLVDEVLGVGDAEFQRRSAARLSELRRRGEAVVLVSHALDSIRDHCHRVVWLEQGRVRTVGPARDILEAYQREQG
jgi:ABC-2 type transport system ATP-binding protein/lipopolysaccharide transport system ATP-binding protein